MLIANTNKRLENRKDHRPGSGRGALMQDQWFDPRPFQSAC